MNSTGRTNTGNLLTPDQINSQAIRGIVGILIIVALTMFTGWLVRGTAEAAGGPAAVPDLVGATTTSTTTTVVKSTTTTTTVVKPTTATTMAAKLTTTTVVKSTTTTTETAVKPTTTTSTPVVKPTPTTTTVVKPTTTTSTTVVRPTTTTTVPATTTTVISKAEAVFLSKFTADPFGDPGSWEAGVKIEVRTDTGAKAAYATVQLVWGGSQGGRTSVSADQDGKVSIIIGPFSDGALKVGVQDIELAGLRYRPELNSAAATIAVSAPS